MVPCAKDFSVSILSSPQPFIWSGRPRFRVEQGDGVQRPKRHITPTTKSLERTTLGLKKEGKGLKETLIRFGPPNNDSFLYLLPFLRRWVVLLLPLLGKHWTLSPVLSDTPLLFP